MTGPIQAFTTIKKYDWPYTSLHYYKKKQQKGMTGPTQAFTTVKKKVWLALHKPSPR